MIRLGRLSALTTASLFALSLGVGAALAAGEPDPPGARNAGPSQSQKPASGAKESSGSKKKQKKSEQQFRDGYRLAYALVQAGQYEAAFAAFKDLDSDDTPDVANYLGYTARKLGDYDLAKYWYERGLAKEPK